MIVVLDALYAQVSPTTGPPPWWDSTSFHLAVSGLILLSALIICLWKTPPEQRAEIIRALGDLFRRTPRGGPPGGGAV